MRAKTVRLKRWKVEVRQDRLNRVHHCRVIAVDPMDARIMAFMLDDGLWSEAKYDDSYVELVKQYTKILEVSNA